MRGMSKISSMMHKLIKTNEKTRNTVAVSLNDTQGAELIVRLARLISFLRFRGVYLLVKRAEQRKVP
jgi:hypothetical protein